jgi:hypothetical protein
MGQKIRFNEAQLKKTIAESVKKVLREMEEVNPEEANWPNGVNPEAHKRWQEEDRQEKIAALRKICEAIWEAERIYEVPDESGHPLDQAYDIISQFIESEGFQDEM